MAQLPAPLQASIAKSDLSLKNVDNRNSYNFSGFCLLYEIPVSFSLKNDAWAAGMMFKHLMFAVVLVTTNGSTHVIDNCSKIITDNLRCTQPQSNPLDSDFCQKYL